MSSQPFEVAVTVEAGLPEVLVSVSPPVQPINVVTSDVALAGPPGPEGPRGPSGSDEATADLNLHISAQAPHPVYDDGASLSLLYENAKV